MEVWLKLMNDPDFVPHKEAINKRMEKAIIPEFFVANLVHPKYQGKGFKLVDCRRFGVCRLTFSDYLL